MNRFLFFNTAELVILWAAIEKQKRFWDETPDRQQSEGYTCLRQLTAELKQALLEKCPPQPSAKSDRTPE